MSDERHNMTFEKWVDTYKPTTDGPLDIYTDFSNTDSRCIWTIIECDDDQWIISDGWHYVNRMGYFITGVPFEGPDYLDIDYV